MSLRDLVKARGMKTYYYVSYGGKNSDFFDSKQDAIIWANTNLPRGSYYRVLKIKANF